MMRSLLSKYTLLVTVLLLAACASPADRLAMTPKMENTNKHFPYSLQVNVTGGMETTAMDSSNISNADFKAAIEEAVSNSKMFKTIVKGKDGDYELNVNIITLSKPLMGFTFTVDMETGWSLMRLKDRTIVMRKSIQSTGTATTSDAFVGVTRLRMAVENAARENVRQGLNAISQLNL